MRLIAQLVITWFTKWDDRHRIEKAVVFSIVVHLRFVLSWAAYFPHGSAGRASGFDDYSSSVAVNFVDGHDVHLGVYSSIETQFPDGPEVEQTLGSPIRESIDELAALAGTHLGAR